MSGLFITIEGGEGVGKSTQASLLAERLAAAGLTVVETREPGGTPVGDRVREILLGPGSRMDAMAELLLFEASRAELVAEEIAPALERGECVVCDRFFDSTTAYQVHGRGQPLELVRTLNLHASRGIAPDVTVLLVLEVGEALGRATGGGADRMEAESSAFHRRVADGFAEIAAAEPDRVVTVDAAGRVEEVAERVWTAVVARPAVRAALGLE